MARSGLQQLEDIIGELTPIVGAKVNQEARPVSSSNGFQQLNELISELDAVIGSRSKSDKKAASKEQKKNDKNDKKEKTNEGQKKQDAKKAPAAADSAPAELTVNSLDFRVGIIRTVKRHETADKLYCEEIDVGEDEPRSIASGLVPFYSLEEMENRLLIVVCNLLPRKLVGFKSHGMVLCASKVGEDGKERVEFIDPPAGAKPGDRVFGEGLVGRPLVTLDDSHLIAIR
jgi:aminoacyl tRNA synthase complex-interacting multifunctional protein 1